MTTSSKAARMVAEITIPDFFIIESSFLKTHIILHDLCGVVYLSLVKFRNVSYNIVEPEMLDNSCIFEPTITLNGNPRLILVDVTPSAAHAVMAEEGRNRTADTHLALARSQKAGAGIAGSINDS